MPNTAIVQRVKSYMVRIYLRWRIPLFGLSREESEVDKVRCVTGAPFQWAAIFHKEDINFTAGHHDLGWYESSEKTCVHKLPCKVSCAYCRTPIMDEGRNMILLFPTLIDFKSEEDRKNFDIRYIHFALNQTCESTLITRFLSY